MRRKRMALSIAFLLIFSGITFAHDGWINLGGYRNAAGELCCGERDCYELPDGDVMVTDVGYFVRSVNETVPFHEVQPSPDGRYWRCQWGGARKCFFAPPPST